MAPNNSSNIHKETIKSTIREFMCEPTSVKFNSIQSVCIRKREEEKTF